MPPLALNLSSIQSRINAACARAGRDPGEIRLVWVSKNHPRESALEALSLGARYFGENRVQEALEKFPLAPAQGQSPVLPPHELHFIGRLQKNKMRKILPLAASIHSIDSVELLEAVNRMAGEMGLRRDVFLQVNASRETAKGGFQPETLLSVLRMLPPTPNLRLAGLMTMGPRPDEGSAANGLEAARECFRELAGLLRAAREQAVPAGLPDFRWLSMGMTGDFEVAVEEGAHFLRIGTGLFDAAPTAAAH